MSFIENVFICLAAPMLIAAFFTFGRGRRMMIFLLVGMSICLLSSYISTFFASLMGMNLSIASVTISPLIEEIMKLLPTLFFLLVFEPPQEDLPGPVIMIAIGFATFENSCYLIQNGASHILDLLIRGFGTGALHVVCGVIMALGLIVFWDRLWLRAVGTIGLLATAATYHGIFNILVSQSGAVALSGYLSPLVIAALLWIFGRNRLLKFNVPKK